MDESSMQWSRDSIPPPRDFSRLKGEGTSTSGGGGGAGGRVGGAEVIQLAPLGGGRVRSSPFPGVHREDEHALPTNSPSRDIRRGVEISREMSGLGDSLQRMHAHSSTDTSGYGGEPGATSPNSGILSPAEHVDRRSTGPSPLAPPLGGNNNLMPCTSSTDPDTEHDYYDECCTYSMHGGCVNKALGDGDVGEGKEAEDEDDDDDGDGEDSDDALFTGGGGGAGNRSRLSPSCSGMRGSGQSSPDSGGESIRGRFLGTGTQSAWLRWSHERRASYRRKLEVMERRQSELERVRLSSPVRKARQESIHFVSPHLETAHLASLVDQAMYGHAAYKGVGVDAVQGKIAEGSKKKGLGDVPPKTYCNVDEVKLTVEEWDALVAYWQHWLFCLMRGGGLLFGLGAVVAGVMCMITDRWSFQTGHAGYSGPTHNGLWTLCSVLIDNNSSFSSSLLSLNNCTFVEFDRWHIAVIGLLVFAVGFDLVALFLSISGLCCTSSLPKKIYYYHSSGESHLLCALASLSALIIYFLTSPYISDIRKMSHLLQSLGYSFLLAVVTCLCQCSAALCLCLDDIVHTIATCLWAPPPSPSSSSSQPFSSSSAEQRSKKDDKL